MNFVIGRGKLLYLLRPVLVDHRMGKKTEWKSFNLRRFVNRTHRRLHCFLVKRF